MRMIIAIRGDVADEVEAKVVRKAVQTTIDEMTTEDLQLTCEVSVVVDDTP